MNNETAHPPTAASDSLALHAAIIAALNDMIGLDRIWPRGLIHPGGPHYRLRGTIQPISIGADECFAFAQLIEAFQPRNAFIIGNAFGLSSVFIAKTMQRCGGRAVVTLDSRSEGAGELGAAVAAKLKECLGANLLTNKVGWSPRDIPAAIDDPAYDLIFIDGDHSHPQVSRDFEGILPIAHERSIVAWHDYWVDGVPQSVAAAQSVGFLCRQVNTSCEMVFGTRSRESYERIERIFPDGVPPTPHGRSLSVWATLARSFGSFLWSRAVNGKPGVIR